MISVRNRVASASGALAAVIVLALAAAASTVAAPVADPCSLVAADAVAAAVGVTAATAASVAATPTTSTCSFGGILTIETGSTALTNPARAFKKVVVAGVPHGIYSTYVGSKQTQIVFYEGSAADGLYVVVRAFVPVKQLRLVRIARLVHAALSGTGQAQAPAPAPSG